MKTAQRWLGMIAVGSMLISAGAFSAAPVANAQTASATFYTWPSTPTGAVNYAKPQIAMKVRYSGLQLTTYSMTLNGTSVPVAYDESAGRFSYVPAQPLSAGRYNVKLSFGFQGYQAKQYSWSFDIAGGAVSSVAAPNAEQLEALKAVNDIRRQLGLSQVSFNGQLSLSAAAHASYQNSSGVISHEETPGTAGYTGATLGQRIAYYGYANDSAAEDISQQRGATPTQAIDDLFDAPYHRIPFLNPSLKEIGYSHQGNFHVILFGIEENPAGSAQVVVSPSSGHNVAAGWNGHEIPDPLRNFPGSVYPVGYPIMAGAYGADVKQVDLDSATLTDAAGSAVQLLNSSPKSDNHLAKEVLLIPAKPLQTGSTYRASANLRVTYTDGRVETVKKDWSFKTENANGQGWTSLHGAGAVGSASASVSHTVSFGLDQSFFSVDQNRYKMVTKPQIVDGFSYLAIRDLEQALGANVDWDGAKGAAIYTKDNRKVVFYVNKNQYEFNGTLYNTETPAFLANRNSSDPRTMIPVRLLSNLLGCNVDFIDATRTVQITY